MNKICSRGNNSKNKNIYVIRRNRMELKGSKTEQNLMTAFAGESQARNKYTYFASVAKKEGYEQIAAIFEEIPLPKSLCQLKQSSHT